MDNSNPLNADGSYTSPPQEPPRLFQTLDASSRQIRLMRLLPSGWSDNSIRSSTWVAEQPKVEIECSLHVVGPEDDLCKSYNALSYAWGDIATSGTAWIRVDGFPVEVSSNLFEALKALQLSLDTEWNRRVEADPTSNNWPIQDFLWVDQLCINQRDLEEKSSQVSIMRDIYASAGSVIGWIGIETQGARRVWPLITDLLACYRDNLKDNKALDEQALTILKARKDHAQDATDLADLFDRPYFKRIWVVQEYSANQNTCLLCGRLQIGGGQLWAVQGIILGFFAPRAQEWHRTQVMAAKDPLLRRYLEDSLYNRGPRMLQQTREALLNDEMYESGWILWLMQLHRWRIGSDPRDKIWAISGLFGLKDENLRPFPVDYRRPTALVYVDIMTTCIMETSSMKIWRYLTGHKSKIEGLPSWAVDWSDHSIDHLVIRDTSAHRCDRPNDGGLESANAETIDVIIDNNLMRINGAALGKITEVSAKHLICRQSSVREMLQEFHEWLPLVAKSAGEETEKLSALSRSILSGTLSNLDTEYGQRKVQESANLLINMSRHNFPGFDLTQYISEPFLEALDPDFKEAESDVYGDSVNLSMWDARIAYCAEQNTFGKVPAAAEVGDILVVCFGCPLIMVFREEPDGSCSVVGPSYFDSFMSGQAMQLISDGKLQKKSFLLQ